MANYRATFGKKIKFVLDGGRSKIGLESTVINLYGNIKIIYKF